MSSMAESKVTGIVEALNGLEENLESLNSKVDDMKKQLSVKSLNEIDKLMEKTRAMATEEAEKIISDYIQQGNEAKVRIIQEAEVAAEKLQSQARRNIEHEFERAKQQLQQEVLEKSLVKAEEIIKGKITAKDQDRLVDEYLAKVVSE